MRCRLIIPCPRSGAGAVAVSLFRLFVAPAFLSGQVRTKVAYGYDEAGNRVSGVETPMKGATARNGVGRKSVSVSKADKVVARGSSAENDTTVFDDGSSLVEYNVGLFDFGPRRHTSSISLPAFTDEDRETHQMALRSSMEASQSSVLSLIANPDRTLYAFGAIPMEEGVSPSGARTCAVPIETVPDMKLAPSVALPYSSQSQEGWAGYGWDIGGISKVTLTNRNIYYRGSAEAADIRDTSSVFSLDGVPLVRNDDSRTSSEYPLVTATGHIIVRPEKNGFGYVSGFTALYPDGRRFRYGTSLTMNRLCPEYPVVEITDLEGRRMEFGYTWDFSRKQCVPASIKYGFSQGQADCTIEFRYEDAGTYVTRYFAGAEDCRHLRLCEIVSTSGTDTVAKYVLSYEERDNASLLTEVRCLSWGEELPPLEFSYGDASVLSRRGELEKSGMLFLSGSFMKDSDTEICYRRGKFVSGSYNDGLLAYPAFSNYVVTKRLNHLFGGPDYKFGSQFSPDQVILFVPSLADFNDVDASLTAGEGFQTVEAVDVDGDGLDEIVKVNNGGVTGSNTELLISVYRCGDSGKPEMTSSFGVPVSGVIRSGDYRSPYRREYFWGDFVGNGRVQLLAVAYDKNYNGNKDYGQTCYATLIDIASESVLSESELFRYTLARSRCLVVCDIDADGRSELCFATDGGMDVYRVRKDGSFAKEAALASPRADVLSSSARPYHVTDINGDGYADIVCPPEADGDSVWTRYAYTGVEFKKSDVVIASRLKEDKFMFIDVNGDGLQDLVKVSGTSLGTYVNLNGDSFGGYAKSQSSITDTTGIVPCNAVDYMGSSAFIKVDGFYAYSYSYTRPASEARYLTGTVDSYGRMTVSTYAYLPQHSLYWTDSALTAMASEGFAKRTLPIYVLSGENSYMSANGVRYAGRGYNYYDGVVHNLGLGFCGFSRIRAYDYVGDVMEIADEWHEPEKMGVVSRVELRQGSERNNPYSVTENSYDGHSTSYGKLSPRLVRSVAADSLTGIVTTTSYVYDDCDCVERTSTARRTGDGIGQTEIRHTTYAHSFSPDRYVLGMAEKESVTKDLDGYYPSWRETAETFRDSLMRPVCVKRYVGEYGKFVENPVGPPIITDSLDLTAYVQAGGQTASSAKLPYTENLVSEIRYGYDSFGNVVSEKTLKYGAEEGVEKSRTYDSKGRHVLTKTDELGRTAGYADYNRYGKPATMTDHLGNVTAYTYDGRGNLIVTEKPDGSRTETLSRWGGYGLYLIDECSSDGSERVVFYDTLGREIRTEIKRFDGQLQRVDREYDAKGRVKRESLPYRGESASYWNTYAYDSYGRRTRLLEASGRETLWSYDGTATITVKEGMTSTKTTDASGNVVRVRDGGGELVYELRDDGSPASISGLGGVTTTFNYDAYGRRTSMDDPSAEVQADSLVWNSDGTSVLMQTNGNGTVTTGYDKYGRRQYVERSGGFDTSCSYDDEGRLVREESTNGTSAKYGYDALGRLESVLETVPGGKFLERKFRYDGNGHLSQVVYFSVTGMLAVENYFYANGQNVEIALDDGTVIRKLVSENDFGMPTEVVTGGISREYGFTEFGLTAYRRMDGGRIQDFSYDFDPLTGNLLSRSDALNGRTEAFGYDELNRLVSANGETIAYADDGNPVSKSGIGTIAYDNAGRPYQATTLYPKESGLVLNRRQNVSYTCFNRPSFISADGTTATFTYNGAGERVRMTVSHYTGETETRYYIGGKYECDSTASGIVERLYLGGDAYSATMVLRRGPEGQDIYNIGRDYLGSVTQIATVDGDPVAEYSYDPWGRLRNPETLETYAAGEEPELFTGRGFTGHEHLQWCGLINMNARLYDPLIGRFLSPDPYVQMPDFTQNFNRYSYALNNPLKYTDESGEFLFTTMLIVGGICAAVFAAGNLTAHAIRGDNLGQGKWAKYFFSGAAAGFVVGAAGYAAFAGASALAASGSWILSKTGTAAAFSMKWGAAGLTTINLVGSAVNGVAFNNGQWFNNFGKSVIGNFYLDENKSFWGQTWEGISRFTWEAPQQFIGYMASSIRNIWSERVDFWGGATFVTNYVGEYDGQGITIGSFVNVNNEDSKSAIDNAGGFDTYMQQAGRMPEMYAHEYGHILQSKKWGWGYLGVPSLLSLINCGFNAEHHRGFWTEKYANTYSKGYYKKYYSSYIWSADYPLKY